MKPAVAEFDDYAANKYGLTLEVQQKVKEALFDLNIQMKIGFRYDYYSNQSIEWEKRRLMVRSF